MTDTAEETTTQEQLEGKASGAPAAAGQPVLRLWDLLTPLICAAVMIGLYFYVHGQQLDSIEGNFLNESSLVSQLTQHILISVLIAFFVLIIAVPLGVLVTRERTKFLAPLVLAIGNLGQAAPSLGLLAIFGIYLFIGIWAVVIILTAYTALSVLRNTIVGLQQVNKGVLDAAKGMGMSARAVLLRVELPLAVPIIGAGARTALVLAVGTVPFGAFLNGGGLGLGLFGRTSPSPRSCRRSSWPEAR